MVDVAGGVFRLDPRSWRVGGLDGSIGGSPPATVEPGAEGGAAGCEALTNLTTLSDITLLDPPALERAVTAVRSSLAAARPDVPPDRTADLDLLVATFEDIAATLAAAGWDTADPALQRLLDDATRGSGEFAAFAAAMTRLLPTFQAGCS